MGDDDPFAATWIRVLAGLISFALIYCFIGWWPRVLAALRHRPGMAYTALGAFFGPLPGRVPFPGGRPILGCIHFFVPGEPLIGQGAGGSPIYSLREHASDPSLGTRPNGQRPESVHLWVTQPAGYGSHLRSRLQSSSLWHIPLHRCRWQ